MKHLLLFTSLTMLSSLFVGCASVERTSPGMMDGLDIMGGESPAVQSVCVRNFGFGLLYICTGVCGDVSYNKTTHDIEGGCILLQEKCNCADCYRSLQDIANDERKVLTNVNFFNNSLPQQGVTGYTDFAGWFFESEDVGCSGVLRSK